MEYKLKEIIQLGSKGYIPNFQFQKTYKDPAVLDMFENELRKQIGVASNARWDVALTIARLLRSGAWVAYYQTTLDLYHKWDKDNPGLKSSLNPYSPFGKSFFSQNPIFFLTFLKEKFGLCRTTVYNYIDVVDEFATYQEKNGDELIIMVSDFAKNYQFWQLIEMLPLTPVERLKVDSNWTREEIRAYKKSLKGESNDSIQPAEFVEAEEKPLTEAQQRFAKYSKDDLIDLVVKLEGSCEEVKNQLDRILKRPVTVNNVLPLKHDLTSLIEKLLGSYDYEIRLNGRKQGVKAFAGVLAKSILDSKTSDINSSNSCETPPIQEQFAV